MRIEGRIVSKGNPVSGAAVEIWLVRKSDGAELLVFDVVSGDAGGFAVHHDTIAGLPCTPQHFSRIKYSVKADGYEPVQESVQFVTEDVDLGDINLIRLALRVSGRILSNGRPVPAAKVTVCIDEVERACIRTGHDGTFERDIEGDYEGRRLAWMVKRFGYIHESGSIAEIHTRELVLGDIDLAPRWWRGFFQNVGIDPEVALWIGIAFLLGLIILFSVWSPKNPEPCNPLSVGSQNFDKAGKKRVEIDKAFDECLSKSPGKCAEEKDNQIIQCMDSMGYKQRK